MQDKISNVEYKIWIVLKRCFILFWRGKIKHYNLYKAEDLEYWSDDSYGNGGGSYSPQTTRKTLLLSSRDYSEVFNLKLEYQQL